jgi:hypothetical protein
MKYLKILEKQEQVNPKSNRWKAIVKIRGKINELKTKNNKMNQQTESWFFEKIAETDKPLAKLTK